jgi:hypothetical protein
LITGRAAGLATDLAAGLAGANRRNEAAEVATAALFFLLHGQPILRSEKKKFEKSSLLLLILN